MYKSAKPFFIITQTPLHVGSGQDLGIVDLPIQRERHTSFPKIESSSLKGSIREAFENITKEITIDNKKINSSNIKEAISLVFGPEEGDAYQGALGFSDAKILLFPVKSMKGVFAWITCPKVITRFKEDLDLCKNLEVRKEYSFENNSFPLKNTISNLGKLAIKGKIILEEYAFSVTVNNNTKKFAEFLASLLGIEEIEDKLVVLSDDDFKDFVNLSTEVITRTKIDNETGTVQQGALFTEEYLPAETVMYSLALASPIFNENKGVFKTKDEKEEELVMEFFEKGLPEVMQIGGNATIGKGIVRIKKWEKQNA